jgi:pimeloyl-ACP methyl ester carboxylesterase
MQRRDLIKQAPAALLGATLAACGGGNAADEHKPTFVFIHGAWHGGWCWSLVVEALGARGYPAIALDLPGHGMEARVPASYKTQDLAALAIEASPLASLGLADYRDRVVAVVQGLKAAGAGPLVLVGHSLGGATLSMVGEAVPDLVHRLVYLTAFCPVKLDSVLAYLEAPSFSTSEVPALFAADPAAAGCLRINHNATDAAYRASCRSAFYADVDDDAFDAVGNLLTPDEPMHAFTDTVVPTAARWGRVPRAYIRCSQDRAFPLAAQDQMIAEADAFTPQNKFVQKTLATSHSPFLSNPAALVDTLVSLV